MKYEIGPWMEYEGVPMFDIPHLRVTPLHMMFLGVRKVSLLLEEIARFGELSEAEQEQADACVCLLGELAHHIQTTPRFLTELNHQYLKEYFVEADKCTEKGRSLEDLLFRGRGHG